MSFDPTPEEMDDLEHQSLQRPPLGVLPRWRWTEMRACDLLGALGRSIEGGKKIPEEWVDETCDLLWAIHNYREERKDGPATSES